MRKLYFFKLSISGLYCYWFIRTITLEFCCAQVLTGFFLFCRYSLSATLLSLILGLHSDGMFWLFGTILWYCGIICFLWACSLCNNICLSWTLGNLRNIIDQFVVQSCKRKQRLCPYIINIKNSWVVCVLTLRGFNVSSSYHIGLENYTCWAQSFPV